MFLNARSTTNTISNRLPNALRNLKTKSLKAPTEVSKRKLGSANNARRRLVVSGTAHHLRHYHNHTHYSTEATAAFANPAGYLFHYARAHKTSFDTTTLSKTSTESEDMPANNKKRPLPSDAPAHRPVKKRKSEPAAQKYYAVKAGMRPGVYLSWKECQEQISGFKGALFKSFLSLEDAQAFVAGKKVKSDEDNQEPTKFYAVARGAFTGIFTDWAEASPAITGQKGPKYKKFVTRAEAVNFIQTWGDEATIAALGDEGINRPRFAVAKDDEDDEDDDEEGDELQVVAKEEKRPAKKTKKADQKIPIVYTDGSSLKNGRADAVAGVGVFFGRGDNRNYSEPLEGDPQTNQRAELTGILQALNIIANTESVIIRSDSKYSINCATTWAKSWEDKAAKEKGGDGNWRTSDNSVVKNQDLVKAIRAKLKEREEAGAVTRLEYVKGHSDDVGNTEADKLAKEGAKKWWTRSK